MIAVLLLVTVLLSILQQFALPRVHVWDQTLVNVQPGAQDQIVNIQYALEKFPMKRALFVLDKEIAHLQMFVSATKKAQDPTANIIIVLELHQMRLQKFVPGTEAVLHRKNVHVCPLSLGQCVKLLHVLEYSQTTNQPAPHKEIAQAWILAHAKKDTMETIAKFLTASVSQIMKLLFALNTVNAKELTIANATTDMSISNAKMQCASESEAMKQMSALEMVNVHCLKYVPATVGTLAQLAQKEFVLESFQMKLQLFVPEKEAV